MIARAYIRGAGLTPTRDFREPLRETVAALLA